MSVPKSNAGHPPTTREGTTPGGAAAPTDYVSMPGAVFCSTTDRDGTVRQYLEEGTEQTS